MKKNVDTLQMGKGEGSTPCLQLIFFYKKKVLNVLKRKDMCIVEGIRFSWTFLIIVVLDICTF